MPTRTDDSLKRRGRLGLLEPSTIFKDIEAQPPLMRDEVMQTYIGRKVNWQLTFRNGQVGDRDEAWLIFDAEPKGVRMVTGTVPLSKYPRLRTLPSGEIIHVRGRIRKIDAVCVDLDIAELKLPASTEAAR